MGQSGYADAKHEGLTVTTPPLRAAKIFTFYALLPAAAIFASITAGRFDISLTDLFELFRIKALRLPIGGYKVIDTVVFHVRLPRIFGAALIGSALSLSGAAYQCIFRNPMVSPGILGVANGAGFGAALGILFSMNSGGVQAMAFLFGCAAVAATFVLGSTVGKNRNSVLLLVLVGMVISTVFASLISLVKYTADPDDKLPVITFWLMGSLSSVTMSDIASVAVPITAGCIPLYVIRWKLNILSFGEDEARSMGVNPKAMRLLVIICSTMITASAISISGIVGWVGLIIPHICRMITGPDHGKLIPFTIVIGAVYMIAVDTLARICASVEMPLGIITSLIGAPFFLLLMLGKREAWQ